MTLSRFVFLQRDWNQDKTTMDNMMDYFATTKDEGPKQILLFPEGTNLTQESRYGQKITNIPLSFFYCCSYDNSVDWG